MADKNKIPVKQECVIRVSPGVRKRLQVAKAVQELRSYDDVIDLASIALRGN